MAEFPPNLDDGELWLPSDIFLNEVPSKRSLHHFSCMEDLAQHVAALTLLKQRNLSNPPLKIFPNRFGPVTVRCGLENPFSQGRYTSLRNGFEDHGHRLYGVKLVPNRGGSDELFYEYQLRKPVQPRVDVFLETRAGDLQRQQNLYQNRLLLRQGSGFGGVGGFVGVPGGTGVFHPRVSNTTTSMAPNPSTSNAVVKKKQVLRHRQEIQAPHQSNSTRVIGLDKHDLNFHYQLPPEMGLPQDWTY